MFCKLCNVKMNVKKTSYMIFGYKKSLNAHIYIDNVLLERQYDAKFLGVILSANLKWNKHVDIVVNKVSKNIGLISKVRHLIPMQLTRNLYFTLVHPYISYCNMVWALPLPTTQLERIMKIQKKYCRLLTFSNYTEHSKPLFIQLSILSVYNENKLQLLSHVYRVVNNLIPNAYSRQYYASNSSIHNYNTRIKNNLHLPLCHTSSKQKTIVYQGPKLWNTLPMDVRSSQSLTVFRNRVKKLLFAQ